MSATQVNIPISLDSDDWKARKALEIKKNLEDLLFKSGKFELTNKTRRSIKKFFNEQINLTDRMFQGFHIDGSIIGTLNNISLEINMLYQIFKKTPTLSFAKAEKTVKKWIAEFHNSNSKIYPSKKHELIITAYEKYMEEVRNKKVTVKTRGLDLVTKCYQYWENSVFDPVLEEQINKACEELKTFVLPSFDDTFTFGEFSESIVPILDISGSMLGIPHETGLFYLLMLVKVFGVKTIHYFESIHYCKTIEAGWETNIELIKQIYRGVTGSTNLSSVFHYLDIIKTNGKNIIIITDGDCDPEKSGSSSNPFHQVTRSDKAMSKYPNVTDCNFIVVNVNQTELKFPYLNVDPQVCYLTGNNPKTINGFIKALCEATKLKKMITPDMILKYSLLLPELELEFSVPKFSNTMTDEQIENLFTVFQKNLPPKKIKNVVQDNESIFLENKSIMSEHSNIE